MSKFNVGDRVRCFRTRHEQHSHHIGRELIISKPVPRTESGDWFASQPGRKAEYVYFEDELELIENLTEPQSTNPKERHGLAKPQLHLIPPSALIEESMVMALGAEKYGPFNWREADVSASTYISAAKRHLLLWLDGEDIDPESGVSHLAHVRGCMGIMIDAKSLGRLVDDRPPQGKASDLMKIHTKPLAKN